MGEDRPRLSWEAVQKAVERARRAHEAVSAEARDRFLAMPFAERLAALDDDMVRAELTPGHRAEILASITAERVAQLGQGASPAKPSVSDPDHAAEMAAWRKRDAAAQAEVARLQRRRKLDRVIWCVAAVAIAVLAVVVLR